jgi:hypothetical protein
MRSRVAAAVDVGQPAALAARQHDRQRIVVAGAELALAGDQVGGEVGGTRCAWRALRARRWRVLIGCSS